MKHTLHKKFIGIIILAMLPFLFYAGFDYQSTLAENRKEAIASNSAKAEEIAHQLEDFLETSQNILYALAIDPAIIHHDSKACDNLVAQLLPLYPLHLNILAADMKGNNFCSAADPAAAHKLNYADKEWFRRGSNGVSVISGLHTSELFTTPAIMITMPVFSDSGEQAAVLAFPLDLVKLREHFLKTENLRGGVSLTVLDTKGNVLICTTDHSATGKPYQDATMVQAISGIRAGLHQGFDSLGLERYFSFTTLESNGWKIAVGIPVREVYQSARQSALRHLLYLIIISLTGISAAFFYSKRLSRQVDLLISGLDEVASGNLAHRIVLPGKDELATAARAFNRMTEERARAEAEVQHLTITLEQRVEQRTAELMAAKNELEAFSYAVSHDLQAPLRHMQGYARIIQEEYASQLPASCQEYLQRIDRASAHMNNLINDLLKLSRLGRTELQWQTVDLTGLSRSVLDSLAASDPERQVTVSVEDGLLVTGDQALLTVAMENLLGNAWKYTRPTAHPLIQVGKTVQNGVNCFYVRDNGAGFDMAYADKLFTPFQRLHSAAEFEGNGIGLATVKRVIQCHGGAIWAVSNQGQGTDFYFTLKTYGQQTPRHPLPCPVPDSNLPVPPPSHPS